MTFTLTGRYDESAVTRLQFDDDATGQAEENLAKSEAPSSMTEGTAVQAWFLRLGPNRRSLLLGVGLELRMDDEGLLTQAGSLDVGRGRAAAQAGQHVHAVLALSGSGMGTGGHPPVSEMLTAAECAPEPVSRLVLLSGPGEGLHAAVE